MRWGGRIWCLVPVAKRRDDGALTLAKRRDDGALSYSVEVMPGMLLHAAALKGARAQSRQLELAEMRKEKLERETGADILSTMRSVQFTYRLG
jgi:hypothetical protein